MRSDEPVAVASRATHCQDGHHFDRCHGTEELGGSGGARGDGGEEEHAADGRHAADGVGGGHQRRVERGRDAQHRLAGWVVREAR